MSTKLVSIIFLMSGVVAHLPARQDTVRITLDEAIHRAASQSVDAVVARNEYVSAYWEYRTYKSELLPELSFSGTLPYYAKSYNSYQNPDGSYGYVASNYSQLDASLSATQNLSWTGGKLSLESSTQKLTQYGEDKGSSWKAIPFALTLEQPLFGFNTLGWKKRIEPVKKKEAEQKLLAAIEETSTTLISHYFHLLLAKVNKETTAQNLENTRKLYKIAEARFKIGQVSENELLQLKVGMLNAESELVNAESELNARMFELRSFLGYGDDVVVEPIIPAFATREIPSLAYGEVLDWASQNNAFTQNIQRRMLESERDLSKAKAERWNISLYASVGRVGQNTSFQNAYNPSYMKDNQVVQVGVKIPLLDWGKRKGQVKIAEANREVVNSKVQKERRDFNQQIFLTVQNFNNQPKQLAVAQETDTIARKRYQTCVEAFVLGKMDVLNLNDAQSAKDIARRNWIQQLFSLWSYYYQIRSLTLYDFIEKKPLSVNYADFVRN